ncbi:heme exporter protein C [Sphaerotilus hippei]|uniref:Heme exporter protein C n=1 Tax=Sphaerotilus hippei TaxID=744406 RepID=A0A318GZL9_9BURK|nr:heme ABC transporter permease CcmC [Sphaerotilus hippei]PXW93374.1 heme exporter protein C [Sphaerotilus hippei]
MDSRLIFYFASPMRLHALAARLVAPLRWLALALLLPGLWLALVVTPADAVQGEGYRLLYLHVPAAWMSMLVYALMALWGFVGLVWRTRSSFMMAHALAPTGALFAALSLVTGALWGQPMWGTWWVWDARLTSSLLLFFLYLGYLALLGANDDPARADRSCAVLALLGALNLPVIYFSVRWWNTLHQGASLAPGKASMAPTMLAALLLMIGAAWAYTAATALRRVQLVIAEREAHARWLQTLGAAGHPAPQTLNLEAVHA